MNEHFNKFLDFTIAGIPCPMCFVEGGILHVLENKKEVHSVKVSSFYIGKYQMTQRLYEYIMKKYASRFTILTGSDLFVDLNPNPSKFKGFNRPVETVNWFTVKAFIKMLNDLAISFSENVEPFPYLFRLPSESEWEYAAKGGIHSQHYDCSGSDERKQVCWTGNKIRLNETMPVGLLHPNELGIFDMFGNVSEWCEDVFQYEFKYPKNGKAWEGFKTSNTKERVYRGGNFFSISIERYKSLPTVKNEAVGFRLVLSPIHE